MAREEVLSFLSGLVGPTGPFDSIEATDSRWRSWLASASDETGEDLLAILQQPPTTMKADVWEEMELKIAEALGVLGQRHPSWFSERAVPLLEDAHARPTLLSALGMAKAREAMPVLSKLLDRGGLTDDELLRMAGALGTMGGPGAKKLLNRMEVLSHDKPPVIQEIAVNREIIAYDQSAAALLGQEWNRALKALGQGDKDAFLEHALPLMETAEPRKALLELLGAVHSIRGVAWLAETGSLSPSELSQAARFLAEAGGPQAHQSLSHLLPIAARSREALDAFDEALGASRSELPSDQLESSLVKTAESLERLDRVAYRKGVLPLLEGPRLTQSWLMMLGALQSVEGLSWLDEPLAQVGAKDTEVLQWLRALAGVSGEEVRATLSRLRSSKLARSEPVRRELYQMGQLFDA